MYKVLIPYNTNLIALHLASSLCVLILFAIGLDAIDVYSTDDFFERTIIALMGCLTTGVLGATFILHSCKNITATSIFAFGCTVFVGFGQIASSLIMESNDTRLLIWVSMFTSISASIVCLVSLLCQRSYCKFSTPAQAILQDTPPVGNNRKDYIYITLFLLASILAFIIFIKTVSDVTFPLVTGAYICATLAFIYYFSCTKASRVLKAAVVILLFILYTAVFFSGYGRNTLVALFFAIAIVLLSLQQRPLRLRWIMGWICIAGGAFMIIGAYIRANIHDVSEILLEGKGLGSALLLLETFCDLLDGTTDPPTNLFPLGLGDTYWKSLIWFVPREVWAEKPYGFGFELTLLLQPEYADAGQSLAATVFGEFFYNFHWIGTICGSVILGYLIFCIDRFGYQIDFIERGSRRHFFRALIYALLASGMIDLSWAGTATFLHREGTALLVLLALYLGSQLFSRETHTFRFTRLREGRSSHL